MTGNRASSDGDLLSLCAILRWFDDDLLRALARGDEDAIDALLASDRVVSAAEPAGALRLREDVRTDALAHLRAESSSEELTLHRRVFDYFLHRMHESPQNDRCAIDEEGCFYHLGELFLLFASRREWHIIAEDIATALIAGPQNIRHLHQLSFYEGYLAIRTQQLDRGNMILTTLLDRDDLDDNLRTQVLNALGLAQWQQTHFDRAFALYQEAYTL